MALKRSIAEYVDDVRSGATTCEEYMAETIERIKKIDGTLHAYISLNEEAVRQARDIDRKMAKGEKVGICLGMPVAIKDNICVKDTRTTCASEMLREYVSAFDATAVARLRSQDAIITGKTNMDEFGMGMTTEFSAFGPSRNPWDIERVPGGSSGGSAIAVSAMECVAALGSDTGGSVRNPASFCGIVGYKPTYGMVSRHGLVSYANSIEQIGPMTNTVRDAAFMLDLISGMDENDDTTRGTQGTRGGFAAGLREGVEGIKIGIIQQMIGEGTDPRVARATRRAVSKMEGLGAECKDISLDMVEYSVAAYYAITVTEAGSNLARYDNLRYGYDLGVEGYEFNSFISKARARFGPEVARRVILGGLVPSTGHAGKYYMKALKVRARLAAEVERTLEDVDVLIAPTVPVLPFRIGEKIDDPVALFLVDFNTVTANLTGGPAVTVPFELCDGLPVGIQMIGRRAGDAQILRAAHALEGVSEMPEGPVI